ncbi:MAG: alkaline phosphatase family protein [Planctomycetes bacterium]|nr:alkaline phosphatase family protein [Planctomycetota bacterium]
MTSKRPQRLFLLIATAVVLVATLGVWVSHQFPALTNGPKSSAEMLEGLFKTPARMVTASTKYIFKHIEQRAVELFIRSCGLPPDTEGRLLAMVRGERFEEVTVPFVFYLYELYGAPATTQAVAIADLDYEEPIEPEQQAGKDRPGLSELVQRSRILRKHLAQALQLFDALFLQVKPGAAEKDLPLRERYDEAAYERIKDLVRELADEFLTTADDALSRETEGNQYRQMLEDIVNDEERLTVFVEFFTDFIRQLSDSWFQSFVQQQQRKEDRAAWVQGCINGNRYYAIADYARSRTERKLVVHVVVDGLQGKLLEGLIQLSSGDREGSGARYVTELVRLHQSERMDPSRYGSKMPPGLGEDVIELVEKAPDRPDYLENLKQYVFAPEASAVIVNVATVDTPSISVRNLPIIISGHPVAGPFGTGIPNFSYIDRRSGRGWYFWGSDVLYMRQIFGNREDEIPNGEKRSEGPGARTLFERLWRLNTVSSMATVDTGALEKIAAEVGMAVGEVQRNYPEKIMLLRFRWRARMEEELNERRRWLREHRNLSTSLLGALLVDPITLKTFHEYARFLAQNEDEGLPDYLLWYNPWPDHFAHFEGPYSDAIIGYQGEYDRLDFYLGKLIEIYQSVKTVDGAATYADRTLFGVVSDHGLVYTPRLVSTDKLLFDAIRDDEIDISYYKLTADEGGLPLIRGRDDIKPLHGFDAVVGSTAGGSYIIDLFDIKGLHGDDAAWQRHLDYHQLRRYRLLSGQTIDWIEQLTSHLKETMDLALVREHGPSPGARWPPEVESVVRIITPDRGEARIYRIRRPDAGDGQTVRYRYELIGERDPLDLVGSVRPYLIPPGGPSLEQVRAAIRRCIESPDGCDDRRWREVLSHTLRPDAVYQFAHLYDSDRAGTINLFPVRHVGMNSEVPGRHAGEAFGEKNGTQLYFGAGLKRAWIQTARNGSLPVTLYHWLVGDERFYALDPERGVSPAGQFGYRSLLDESAFESIR